MDTKNLPHEIEKALELFRQAERNEYAQSASTCFLKALDLLDTHEVNNPGTPFKNRIQQIKLSNNRAIIRKLLEEGPLNDTGILDCVDRTKRETEINLSQDPDLKEKFDIAMGFSEPPINTSRRTTEVGQRGHSLYQKLMNSQFSFLPDGQHHIKNIYSETKSQLGNLCNDSLLCSQNCKNGNNQPEWMHIVRNALQKLKSQGIIKRGNQHGYWVFGEKDHGGKEKDTLGYQEGEEVREKRAFRVAKLLEVLSSRSSEEKIDWEEGGSKEAFQAKFSGNTVSIGCENRGSFFILIENAQGDRERISGDDKSLDQFLDSSEIMEDIYEKAKSKVLNKKGIDQAIDSILIELEEDSDPVMSNDTLPIPRKNLKDFPEGLQQIFEVCQKVWDDFESYSDAVRKVAESRRVAKNTVIDKCTRKLKINTNSFIDLLKDRNRLINHLLRTFPQHSDSIRQVFSSNSSPSTTINEQSSSSKRASANKQDHIQSAQPIPTPPMGQILPEKSISKEPDYIRQYRSRLKEPNSMPSRILRHLEEIGSTTRERLQQDCVSKLGYTSKTSGSINASIKVLEVDGYIKIDGNSPNSKISFVTRYPAQR
jgi:hypothetical protein